MTKAQKRYHRELWPIYGIDLPFGTIFSQEHLFQKPAPLILEIGFGKAETLIHRAIHQPQYNFIGCEVHKPSVASALKQIHDHQLQNVAIVHKDALLFLCDHFTVAPLKEIWVFFPNPWPKDKQRRIIRPFTLEIIQPFLTTGTTLHFATDVHEYARFVQDTLNCTNGWSSLDSNGEQRPQWRQVSKYEKKGLSHSREIIDLTFIYHSK
jgi:tRNA (guanine-N7-)-methyltransferase